jgi:hypothetical protein
VASKTTTNLDFEDTHHAFGSCLLFVLQVCFCTLPESFIAGFFLSVQATKQPRYLTDARNYYGKLKQPAYSFETGDKTAGLTVLMQTVDPANAGRYLSDAKVREALHVVSNFRRYWIKQTSLLSGVCLASSSGTSVNYEDAYVSVHWATH